MLNGPVLAEDQDIGPNAVVKYYLLGARQDLFTVDANTGNIMTPQQIDRERQINKSCDTVVYVFVSPSRCDICASGGDVGP